MLSYLRTYFTVASVLLLSVGAINLTIDPLWYGQGNKLTKFNTAFNERLTKTNSLLNSDKQKYDCLIFGSSRLTLLNSKAFKKNTCFNYAFSLGTVEEFIKYGEYAKEKGINPKKIYVGIDSFNFNLNKKMEFKHKVEVAEPKPIYQSYLFSTDILRTSLKIITHHFSSSILYDENFQGIVSEKAPKYKPKFSDKISNNKCDFYRISYYRQISKIFPNAEIVGYVPPTSAWRLFNVNYAGGTLNCELQGIYEASKSFDASYDFSYPSEITTRIDNTYDGIHYYPEVHDRIAKILEGERSSLGVRIHQYSLEEYQQFHRAKLKEFLQKEGEGKRWDKTRR